jgi:hypothetical protein
MGARCLRREVRIPSRLERLYVALVALTCGTWDALAAVLGPHASPLPQALGIGTLVLSVPWWDNRRRRAKVRVELTIATWPDIAQGALKLSSGTCPHKNRWGVIKCSYKPGGWGLYPVYVAGIVVRRVR